MFLSSTATNNVFIFRYDLQQEIAVDMGLCYRMLWSDQRIAFFHGQFEDNLRTRKATL